MRAVWTIARLSFLENGRKQVFQATCLLMLAVIGAATLLSVLTDGVKIKILKDLCVSCIVFGGAGLSIVLASSALPNDIDSRTIYPVLARPVARWQIIAGRFLGCIITVAVAVVLMGGAFAVVIASYEGRCDALLGVALLFILLECCIICAIATSLSTLVSPAVAGAMTFLLFLFGTIKIGYIGSLITRMNGLEHYAVLLPYHVVPNLECFNLKPALVHHEPIPASYLLQVALYALAYTLSVLALGSWAFSRREV